MLPEPLHPAVVHFPIVLVVLLPFAAVAALIMIRRGGDARRLWIPVVAIALALGGSSWIAVQTGEREEEAVEEVASEAAIHEHEESAELFLPLAFGVFLLTGAGLLKDRVGSTARYVSAVATVLLLGAGYRVGHTGGELVYEHGAANAYAVASSDASWTDGAEHHDDDDHPRRDRRDN